MTASQASSHAYINGYLDRPIVDEWFDILGQVIQRKFLGLKLASNKFSMQVSHDVDRPSRYGFINTKNLVRRMIMMRFEATSPAPLVGL